MASIAKVSGPIRRLIWFLTAVVLAVSPSWGQIAIPLPVPDCATPARGCWKQLPTPEVTAVNAIALKTGTIMLHNRGFTSGEQLYQIYNPRTDKFSPSPPAKATTSHNMYCAAFDQTGENGDVLFAGGLSGEDRRKASLYDPDTDTWTAKPDMEALRFYPTLITLSRREMLIFDGSGSIEANIPERYNIRNMTWDSLFAAEYGSTEPPPNDFELPIFPRMHVLSTGQVIYTGSEKFIPAGGEFTRILDPVFEVWRQPFSTPDPIIGESGVMYESDTIMKGGGTDVYTLAATTPGAQWAPQASMNQDRDHFFLVALADGNVLAVGDVVTPEIYDTGADTWTNMAPASLARGDHSSAVLLPDGRVIHAGPTLNAEVYSPPYLFDSNGLFATRPVIAEVSGHRNGVIRYGEVFKVFSLRAALVDKIRLIRLGAVTHSWDMGQQSMALDFAPACCDPTEEPGVNGNLICFEGATCCADGKWSCNNGDGSPDCPPTPLPWETPTDPEINVCPVLLVDAPQHPFQSPPGYHYLTIVDAGVPSKAAIVQAIVCP